MIAFATRRAATIAVKRWPPLRRPTVSNGADHLARI